MGRLGDGRAVEPLIAALKDGDEGVRREAAEALGRLGDARAVEPLVAALAAPRWSARKAAAAALYSLYHSDRLDAVAMQAILAECERMAESHNDRFIEVPWESHDHLDEGIGVAL